jgi:hypothetical protein
VASIIEGTGGEEDRGRGEEGSRIGKVVRARHTVEANMIEWMVGRRRVGGGGVSLFVTGVTGERKKGGSGRDEREATGVFTRI